MTRKHVLHLTSPLGSVRLIPSRTSSHGRPNVTSSERTTSNSYVRNSGVVRPKPVIGRPRLNAANDLTRAAGRVRRPLGGSRGRRPHPRRQPRQLGDVVAVGAVCCGCCCCCQRRLSAVLFRVGAEDFYVGDADVFAALKELLPEADHEFAVRTPKTTTDLAIVAPTGSEGGLEERDI